jgi:hypothetical protein
MLVVGRLALRGTPLDAIGNQQPTPTITKLRTKTNNQQPTTNNHLPTRFASVATAASTTASPAAITTTTAAATESTTTAAHRFRTCLIDNKRAAFHLEFIQLRDRPLSLFVSGHFDETKPARTACCHIAHDAGAFHGARPAEELGKLGFAGLIR